VSIHLSGRLEQLAEAVRASVEGRVVEPPFVILAQPGIVDDSRAPKGMQTVWAYCHVPSGSAVDMSAAIESHIERFAPGFRDLVVARFTRSAIEIERYNPNYIGGDINSGMSDLGQLFFRPMLKADPYATSAPDIFLCSSSTPPGGGVHGMCGYWAARSALKRRFGNVVPAFQTRVQMTCS
jgi:phytoene dehydrogenase-like protein